MKIFCSFQDFLAQLKEEKKRQKTLWKIDIELREPSEDPEDNEDLPVVVLDDTEEPTMSSSDNTKQVTLVTLQVVMKSKIFQVSLN